MIFELLPINVADGVVDDGCFFYLQVLFFYKMLNFLMTLLSLSKGQPKSKIKTDKTVFFSKRVANFKKMRKT